MRSNKCENILCEERRNNTLTDESLAVLLDKLRDYVYSEYSINPTSNDLLEVSEIALKIFPSLISNDGKKTVYNVFDYLFNNFSRFFIFFYYLLQDILYNQSKRSGLLYEKVRYKQRKFNRKQAAGLAENDKVITEDDSKEMDELIKYFNQCILPRDKSEIMKRLKISAQLRKNQKNNDILTSMFHLYRVDADMVILYLLISIISFMHYTRIGKILKGNHSTCFKLFWIVMLLITGMLQFIIF